MFGRISKHWFWFWFGSQRGVFFSAFASCVQQFVTYSAATVGCKPAHENFHWLNQGALQASARFYLWVKHMSNIQLTVLPFDSRKDMEIDGPWFPDISLDHPWSFSEIKATPGSLQRSQVFTFDLDMISINCVAPMSPVSKFSSRCSGPNSVFWLGEGFPSSDHWGLRSFEECCCCCCTFSGAGFEAVLQFYLLMI